jgi:hypothetical protein
MSLKSLVQSKFSQEDLVSCDAAVLQQHFCDALVECIEKTKFTLSFVGTTPAGVPYSTVVSASAVCKARTIAVPSDFPTWVSYITQIINSTFFDVATVTRTKPTIQVITFVPPSLIQSALGDSFDDAWNYLATQLETSVKSAVFTSPSVTDAATGTLTLTQTITNGFQ